MPHDTYLFQEVLSVEERSCYVQQASSSRSQRPVGLFRTLPLSEISQTYAWFEERRANAPVFRDEQAPFPLWQVFHYEDVLPIGSHSTKSTKEPTFAIAPIIYVFL